MFCFIDMEKSAITTNKLKSFNNPVAWFKNYVLKSLSRLKLVPIYTASVFSPRNSTILYSLLIRIFSSQHHNTWGTQIQRPYTFHCNSIQFIWKSWKNLRLIWKIEFYPEMMGPTTTPDPPKQPHANLICTQLL